jgi:hypothetical protein
MEMTVAMMRAKPPSRAVRTFQNEEENDGRVQHLEDSPAR